MLRRVVSATRENGRHFWRCAERPSRCSYRCWVNFSVPNVSSAGRWRKVGTRSDSGGGLQPNELVMPWLVIVDLVDRFLSGDSGYTCMAIKWLLFLIVADVLIKFVTA